MNELSDASRRRRLHLATAIEPVTERVGGGLHSPTEALRRRHQLSVDEEWLSRDRNEARPRSGNREDGRRDRIERRPDGRQVEGREIGGFFDFERSDFVAKAQRTRAPP